VLRQVRTLATAVRELADRWKNEGCKAFDEGNTPAEVAEAAGRLRCALELSQLLEALERHRPSDMRGGAPDQAETLSGRAFPSDRRAGPLERRRKTRSDRRKRF
jgi:hypothetical protein